MILSVSSDSLLSDESELMFVLTFLVARRRDGERVRIPLMLFPPFLIDATGRGFDDKEEDRCINVMEAASSSFPKLSTPSKSDNNTFCFVGMVIDSWDMCVFVGRVQL